MAQITSGIIKYYNNNIIFEESNTLTVQYDERLLVNNSVIYVVLKKIKNTVNNLYLVFELLL